MSRRTLCASALSGLRPKSDVDACDELVEMSDNGMGAETVYSEIDRSCFDVDGSEGHYVRMARRARDYVRRHDPSLLPTLNAILRNGIDRQESIFELAKKSRPKRGEAAWASAEKRYYRSRARLLRLFGAA